VGKFAAANICNYCNQRCIYCMEGERKSSDFTALSLAQVKRNLKILKEREGVDCINIMGGEFTLRPDALAILDYLRNIGIPDIIVTTNLSRLSDPVFAREIACRVTALDVTVPALSPEAFGEITGGGSHANFLKALENLRAASIPFNVNIVIVRRNLRELAALVKMLRSFFSPDQLSLIKLKYPAMKGRMLEHPEQLVPVPEFMRVLRGMVKVKSRSYLLVSEVPLCAMRGMEEYSQEACRRLESAIRNNFLYLNGKTLTFAAIATGHADSFGEYCRSCGLRALCIGPRHLPDRLLDNTLDPRPVVRRIQKRIPLLHESEKRIRLPRLLVHTKSKKDK